MEQAGKATPETLHDFCKDLGRANIARANGVKRGTVDVAVTRGGLPAKWYAKTYELCRENGRDCPARFFTFASPLPTETAAEQTPDAASNEKSAA